jgi:hypothetical protein
MVFALPAHAQKKKKNLPTEAQVEVPNCVWIDTLGLFADQTEVANIHWLEYCVYFDDFVHLVDMPEEFSDFESFQKEMLLTDTTVWLNVSKYLAKHYLTFSTFRFFPVVGITKKQAEAFCVWRSKIVNENYKKRAKGISKEYEVEVTYRLPTEDEWEIIAKTNIHNPSDLSTRREKEKEKEKERKRLVSYVCVNNRNFMTDFIFIGLPNQYNLYNTIGNVAEMVQEEGIAKGGSWFHTLEESAIKERQIYTNPTAWLGFRCVATVKLTPKSR